MPARAWRKLDGVIGPAHAGSGFCVEGLVTAFPNPPAKAVLRVGGGDAKAAGLHPLFPAGLWRERWIEAGDRPPDLSSVGTGTVDAVYAAHILDRRPAAEVAATLAEFRRVLTGQGVVVLAVLDLQAVAEAVAADRLDQAVCVAADGPLNPLDLLYGGGFAGPGAAAPRTGFTARSLGQALDVAGFVSPLVDRDRAGCVLRALAFVSDPDPAEMAAWRNLAFPAPVPVSAPAPASAPAGPETATEVLVKVFALARENRLGVPDLIAVTERLGAVGNHGLVASLYEVWLEHAQSPLTHLVWYNYGVTLGTLKRHQEAEKAFRQALAVAPAFGQARFALGSELERQGRSAEAVEQWWEVLASLDGSTPDGRSLTLTVLNNLGRLLEIMKQFQESEAMLTRSLALDPTQTDVIWHWIHLRQKQCAWPIYKPMAGLSREFLERHISPLALLSAVDDPTRQLAAAQQFVSNRVAPAEPLSDGRDRGHQRLRIGYLSSDFCMHPVAMLVVELLERHDRARVEVYGFCWTREDGSDLRRRVIRAMDHFIPIGEMDDDQAARCIAGHEIDVLVDLQGLTSGCRAGILARRPAPVQVTYLGFPGVTALPGVDYVIADRFVLPPESARFFAEKPLYLPTVFQVSDRQRPIGPRPARADVGLPEDAVVLCCFNNSYKFTEEIFTVWLNIMRRCPHAVLWLLADNEWQRDNLIRTAAERGMEPSRLVFAGRTSPPDYLARYRLADLFLDTFPFNAGTTANDALWMGLPVLTRSGRTFASRMAGSLLRATGLSGLITNDFRAYEDRAVALAAEPAVLAGLRRKLERDRDTCPLFDIPRLVREIEDAFLERVRSLPR